MVQYIEPHPQGRDPHRPDEGRQTVAEGRQGDRGSAPVGKKIDLLKKNRNVCFEFDADTIAVPADTSCGRTMRYRSVIGYDIADFVEDLGEKRAALDVIMRQYAEGTHGYSDETLRKTAVIKVEIREISGEKSGY